MNINPNISPRSVLLTEDELSLFVDYYQLTMGQADFQTATMR